MNNEQPGVLAVMARASDAIHSAYLARSVELDAARAAVAELIEVNKRIAGIAHKKAGGGFWMVPNTEITDLRAALARVGGAA